MWHALTKGALPTKEEYLHDPVPRRRLVHGYNLRHVLGRAYPAECIVDCTIDWSLDPATDAWRCAEADVVAWEWKLGVTYKMKNVNSRPFLRGLHLSVFCYRNRERVLI
jgi:hypothetical protein